MKLNDKKKLQKYNQETSQLPSDATKETNIMGSMYNAGSSSRARELWSSVANIKHYDIQMRHMARKQSFKTINRKYGWTFTHFIHGKFGFDALFLFFGIFGIAIIPYYFWTKLQVRRKYVR